VNVLLITPNLNAKGGVSAYWKSLLCVLDTYQELKISKLEIGGHGKNIFGPFSSTSFPKTLGASSNNNEITGFSCKSPLFL